MNTGAAHVKVHLLLTAICFAGCLFFSIPAACILLLFSVLTLTVSMIYRRQQRQYVARLCDDVDRILRGAEHVTLNTFEEGELSILASEIQKMTVRLREQNTALQHEQQFMKESLEDISHQLRTPLTSMMLVVGILRKPDLSRQQQTENLQELFTLLSRMQWLIETLLTLSRLDAGAVRFQTETIDCRTLIREAFAPISIALELKDITVQIETEGEPQFQGDFQYCTEGLSNLLKNCMEHTPPGGTITVKATENAIYTGILITDSGSGIAEADLPHLFERFYRGSDFAKNGYGIGLAFARKVFTAQHGSLQAGNAKPHGAQFDLRIYKAVV